MNKIQLYGLLALVFALFVLLPMVLAQDVTPTPVVNVDLQPAYAAIGAYLLALATLAGGLQVYVAKLTIPILEPIKSALKLDDKGYQVLNDIALFLTALFTLLFTPAFPVLKGLLAPALALSPITVPDFAIGALSVTILVMGQDLIKGLITKWTALNPEDTLPKVN